MLYITTKHTCYGMCILVLLTLYKDIATDMVGPISARPLSSGRMTMRLSTIEFQGVTSKSFRQAPTSNRHCIPQTNIWDVQTSFVLWAKSVILGKSFTCRTPTPYTYAVWRINVFVINNMLTNGLFNRTTSNHVVTSLLYQIWHYSTPTGTYFNPPTCGCGMV